MHALGWVALGVVLCLAALWVAMRVQETLEDARSGVGIAREAHARLDTLTVRVADLELRALRALEQAPARVEDLVKRVTRAEARLASMDLTILDTAEKVAHRLTDRERKRAAPRPGAHSAAAAELDDAVDAADDAAWWARARAAHPLPGMPAQMPAELTLFEDTDEEGNPRERAAS